MSRSSETGEFDALSVEPASSTPDSLVERLQAAFDPNDALDCLRDVGLTAADIATATGVNDQTPSRWRHGQSPARNQADKIDQLRAIVTRLLVDGVVRRDEVASWLRVRHAGLGERRPLDVIRVGDFYVLHDFVKALGEPAIVHAARRHSSGGETAEFQALESILTEVSVSKASFEGFAVTPPDVNPLHGAPQSCEEPSCPHRVSRLQLYATPQAAMTAWQRAAGLSERSLRAERRFVWHVFINDLPVADLSRVPAGYIQPLVDFVDGATVHSEACEVVRLLTSRSRRPAAGVLHGRDSLEMFVLDDPPVDSIRLEGPTTVAPASDAIADRPTLEHVKHVKAQYEDHLLSLDGVQGVAVGSDHGEPVITVFGDPTSPDWELPQTLDGVRVLRRESGIFHAQ